MYEVKKITFNFIHIYCLIIDYDLKFDILKTLEIVRSYELYLKKEILKVSTIVTGK